MLIARFAQVSKKKLIISLIPEWIIHQVSNKVFEQDMAFLASQNEVLNREGLPTSRLYLNLRSSDVFVLIYRKWLDKVGHGMPYYIGHKSLSQPAKEAVVEAAPAGFIAATASSPPMKGAITTPFATKVTNRYFRHVVHCSKCRKAFQNLKSAQKLSALLPVLSFSLGIVPSRTPWRVASVVVWYCSYCRVVHLPTRYRHADHQRTATTSEIMEKLVSRQRVVLLSPRLLYIN
ncbi:hypothetical protein L7F22_018649 [Adiantum nelumboides]|nr:hypothetical protein [Adiantum nelumboides]